MHSIGANRNGFYLGGLIWADYLETSPDPLNGFHQIVGHTKVNDFITESKGLGTSNTFIDALSTNLKIPVTEVENWKSFLLYK